jgi:hypothetical protein
MALTIWGQIEQLQTPAKHFLTALAVEIEGGLFFHNDILPKSLKGKKDSEPSSFDGESAFGRTAESLQKELEEKRGLNRPTTGHSMEEHQKLLRMMKYQQMVENGEEIEFVPATEIL